MITLFFIIINFISINDFFSWQSKSKHLKVILFVFFVSQEGLEEKQEELPVRIYQSAHGRLKSSSEITSTGLPLRPSLSTSEPRKHKKRNWVLPEGQTVLEKSVRLQCKRPQRAETERCAQPNIDVYLDLFVRLRNLLL